MRKQVKVALANLVIVGILLAAFGCSSAAPAPAPTAAPAKPAATAASAAPAAASPAAAAPAAGAPTSAPAAQVPAGPVIELKYHDHDPAESYTSQYAHNAFAKLIGEKTNGRVKVTVYPAETLGKSATAVDMAINGIADISWGLIGQFTGRFPVTDLLGLPMLGLETAPQGSKALMEAYQTSPEIQKEWEQVHVLILHTNSPNRLAFGSKKVQTMDDMKGARLRSPGGAPFKYLQALGASPVNVPPAETFEAIQKGTIDGAAFDWNGIGSFRLDDISKYVLEEAFYPSTFFLIMNKKKWDSLGPELQKVFNDLTPEIADMYGRAWEGGSDQYKKIGLGKGVQVLKLSDAEKAKWTKAAEPVWDEYAKLADAKGANGKALVDKIKGLMTKYKP